MFNWISYLSLVFLHSFCALFLGLYHIWVYLHGICLPSLFLQLLSVLKLGLKTIEVSYIPSPSFLVYPFHHSLVLIRIYRFCGIQLSDFRSIIDWGMMALEIFVFILNQLFFLISSFFFHILLKLRTLIKVYLLNLFFLFNWKSRGRPLVHHNVTNLRVTLLFYFAYRLLELGFNIGNTLVIFPISQVNSFRSLYLFFNPSRSLTFLLIIRFHFNVQTFVLYISPLFNFTEIVHSFFFDWRILAFIVIGLLSIAHDHPWGVRFLMREQTVDCSFVRAFNLFTVRIQYKAGAIWGIFV